MLYDEPGSGGAPLLWGPGFALAGFLLELALGGPTHVVAWAVIGVGLFLASALWVYARRRFLSVRVTDMVLWQGREALPVERIAEVRDGDPPARAKPLGGGYTVPRKYQEVPLTLDDGRAVLAWARDAEALRAALRRALDAWENRRHE
ncbi:Protein of unknown function [Amycolatopsis arida]|uniref:DUF3093 domain-containing protein n=1 Tax=Amycolatopsis arida TaxID=587909 RepID=A0A1I6A9Z5_9PSEU|nr:Protein of unknown function (DUF3093) [Amycolatopsis arida]SFQ65521.1 Protein of unknown function [Amycolatopsis arida]